MTSKLPDEHPDWERVTITRIAGYDLYHAGWRSGWVWMALVARENGTYMTGVGRTKFKFRAKRRASECVMRLLGQLSVERYES